MWMEQAPDLSPRGRHRHLDPFTVDDAGYFSPSDAPGFGARPRTGGPARVIDDNGKKGDANKARHRGADRCKHASCRAAGSSSTPYPHSWRSKKPVIFP